MEVIETPLKDCYIIKNKVFGDNRGFFLESFSKRQFEAKGLSFEIKQVNFAKSQKGVLRGLHYQTGEFAQTKLIGVISGAVLDVVVDIRPDSPTYKGHFKLDISSPEIMLLVPKGFAHGYYTLVDETIFYYGVDNFYEPASERGIRYDDSSLKIDWQLEGEVIISLKDLNQPNF